MVPLRHGARSARRPLLVIALAITGLSACADVTREPLAPEPSASRGGAAPLAADGAALRWNRRARALVVRDRTDPPWASRVYALLSVAQRDAYADAARVRHQPRAAIAAVDAASLAVLASLYPADALDLATAVREAAADPAAAAIGRAAAARVLAAAATDGADAAWAGGVPTGEGMWYSSATPAQAPLRPTWGRVRTWHIGDVSALRPPPPPMPGTSDFAAALAEARAISDGRTTEQLRIALHWADGAGTATPPGHWNVIADSLMVRHAFTEERAVALLHDLNTAMMDAGIACWDAKFAYWLLRPSQADDAITTPVGLPNFPAYTSGHSAFSGAAAEVIGHHVPNARRAVEAMAVEAAVSRLYGGIHYRFDSDRGLEQGRAAGLAALRRY